VKKEELALKTDQEKESEKQKKQVGADSRFSFHVSSRGRSEDDLVEKPEFAKEKKLFQKRKFRRQYRIFRNGGLGRFDSFFNAVYIILCEKSVENEKKRLKKVGEKKPRESRFLEFHGPLLRVFSVIARLFRRMVSPFLSERRSEKTHKKNVTFGSLKDYVTLGAAAVLALVVVLHVFFTLRTPAALCAEIDGEIIGIVEDTSVVDRAIARLEDNAKIVLGTNFRFPYRVEYRFTRRKSAELTDKNKIFETLFSYVQDSICTAGGLYIDDTLVAVCEDAETIEKCLERFIREHTDGTDAGIFNEVRVITQAYPTAAMISSDRLWLLLEEMSVPLDEREKEILPGETITSDSENKNEAEQIEPSVLSDFQYVSPTGSGATSNQPQPVSDIKLDLYTSKVLRYDADVPYETVYQESSEHYVTMADVTTQGVNGSATVEAKVYYVDGKEVRRDILSQTVKKEAVNRVISVGTKLLPEDLGYTSFTASPKRFIVPRIARVSYYWGVREDGMHYAWDIPSPKGSNIYASASGRVIVAKGPDGFFAESYDRAYSGYGYCVVIQHDDGFSTLYAHCSKINVTLGQEVKQGEKIAEIGNTGNSQGNHVHWEVMLNGVKKNPALYTYEGTATIYDR